MLAIGSFIEVEALNGVAQEIELDSDDSNVSGFREFEKKGILENITATSFTVNGFKIDIDSQIIIDNNEKLVDLDGFRVEVEGVIIGNRYVAREIERD